MYTTEVFECHGDPNCTCEAGSKALCDSCTAFDNWITMSDEEWRNYCKYCNTDEEISDDICVRCGSTNDNHLTICTECELILFGPIEEKMLI